VLILKRLIIILLVIAAIVIGVMLFLANTDSVALDLIVYKTPPINVSVIMFASLFCGVIIGMIVMSLSLFREKMAHWSDVKRHKTSEAEARRLAEERQQALARMEQPTSAQPA
tara:strand:- start:46540 stop:46878 length:339 start_codon:yes stop_codon:yes gene_type:complete